MTSRRLLSALLFLLLVPGLAQSGPSPSPTPAPHRRKYTLGEDKAGDSSAVRKPGFVESLATVLLAFVGYRGRITIRSGK